MSTAGELVHFLPFRDRGRCEIRVKRYGRSSQCGCSGSQLEPRLSQSGRATRTGRASEHVARTDRTRQT